MHNELLSNDKREIILTEDEVIIASKDGGPTHALSHRDLIWFVRELIDQIADPHRQLNASPTGKERRKHHYKKEIKRTLHKLAQEIDVEEIDDWRLNNMIAKGFVVMLPAERRALAAAIERVWLPKVEGLDPSKVDILLIRAQEIAKAKAQNAPEDNPISPNGFAKLLGLRSGAGCHSVLAPFCGDYLIFRRLASASMLVVSHLLISQDEEARYPATFVTRTSVPENSTPQASVVRGVVYEPDDVRGVLFATGKYLKTKQTRTTILRPTPKLGHSPQPDLDIEGIRLGLSRTQRWPVAYIIWCSRVREQLDWETIGRVYPFRTADHLQLAEDAKFFERYGMQPQEFFEAKVCGFEKIMKRLAGKSFLALDQGGSDDE